MPLGLFGWRLRRQELRLAIRLLRNSSLHSKRVCVTCEPGDETVRRAPPLYDRSLTAWHQLADSRLLTVAHLGSRGDQHAYGTAWAMHRAGLHDHGSKAWSTAEQRPKAAHATRCGLVHRQAWTAMFCPCIACVRACMKEAHAHWAYDTGRMTANPVDRICSVFNANVQRITAAGRCSPCAWNGTG